MVVWCRGVVRGTTPVRVRGVYTFAVRGVKKENLPEKTCPVCGLPFRWRKKWSRDWDSVVYCSRRCRSEAKVSGRGPGPG